MEAHFRWSAHSQGQGRQKPIPKAHQGNAESIRPEDWEPKIRRLFLKRAIPFQLGGCEKLSKWLGKLKGTDEIQGTNARRKIFNIINHLQATQ